MKSYPLITSLFKQYDCRNSKPVLFIFEDRFKAAHCLKDVNPRSSRVMGSINRVDLSGQPGSMAVEFDMLDLKVHQDYRHELGTPRNDIALLKLSFKKFDNNTIFPVMK